MIDLSHPLSIETPAFPGDPPVDIRVLDSTDRNPDPRQRHLNCSTLTMSVHCGTHLDAPFHFYGDRKTVDQLPLETVVGLACMLRIAERNTITAKDLAPFESVMRRTRRVILNTGWHHRWKQPEYFTEHPVLTGEAAEYVVRMGVLLIGVDFPSVDRPPFEAHLCLLGNDVVIVENLTNLDAVPDVFRFVALPLKIVGRDGSPVRAVAEFTEGT